jgi:hypothetical protein
MTKAISKCNYLLNVTAYEYVIFVNASQFLSLLKCIRTSNLFSDHNQSLKSIKFERTAFNRLIWKTSRFTKRVSCPILGLIRLMVT